MRAALALLSLLLVAPQNGYDLFQKALVKERAEGKIDEALQIYERILHDFGSDRALAAKTLVRIGQCREKLGKPDSRSVYEQVIRDYADQREPAAEARARIASLGQAGTIQGSAMVTRHVWEGPELQTAISISPDGKYLVSPDGSLNILQIATGNKRVLVQGEPDGETYNAVFSPDGKRIAYGWFRYKDYGSDLRIVALDGSAPRVLYHNSDVFPGYVAPMAWSSDGKQIVTLIPRSDRTNQIALISATDGSARILKTLDWHSPAAMSFSPDNKYIAYDFIEKEDSDDHDIFVLAADGSRETRAVAGRGNDILLGWEPHGDRLLFRSDRKGPMNLWSVEVSGGEARREAQLIKTDVGNVIPVGFTNGGSYYYRLQTNFSDVYTVSLTAGNDFAGQPESIRARLLRANSGPDWTADGKYLAYVASRIGTGQGPSTISVVIRSMDTRQEREIPSRLQSFRNVRWSPDARSILASGYDLKGRHGLFVIDAQNGEVTNSLFNAYSGQWSRDGRVIFAAKNGSAGEGRPLVRVDLESGTETRLFTASIGVGLAEAVSPDGKQIAFSVFEKDGFASLKVVSTAGGDAREIFRLKEPENFGSIAWTRDGAELFFVLRNFEQNKHELARVSISGGALRRLGIALNPMTQLSIDPSGHHLAFDAGDTKCELWVMENFLPSSKASR